MKFNSTHEIAMFYGNLHKSLAYPTRPNKPAKFLYKSNKDFGIDMDKWEEANAQYKLDVQEYHKKSNELTSKFKKDLLEFVGLSLTHPKAEIFWHLVWEHGHSSGYTEVASWAEELAELL